ncbi:MAG: Holliday junction branch migration protein RuvA [Actinomycetaceae bacterium]|nr:Holliday junction branch migration protein RuvA [Actinomycetaceae bacterium]
MIAHIRGNVVDRGAAHVVIDVGGVGYRLETTPEAASRLHVGEEARLFTHLAVREDALTLYGFATADERDCFIQLIAVPRIGPKLAVATLAIFTPDDLRALLAAGDAAGLTRIPGVGKKSAQRMIIDIGDKLGPAGATAAVVSPMRADLVSALTNLGWNDAQAEKALAAATQVAAEADDATVLREALKYLGARRG